MNTRTEQKNIKIEDLILDIHNPRFAELYSGSAEQAELIEYLLFAESAKEIANNIVDKGFYYPDEPLWVIETEDNKFLVKDGNRRCAAVKFLLHSKKHKLDVDQKQISKLPALVFEDEKYLSQRIQEKHTNSLFRDWDRIAKALEAYRLFKDDVNIEELKDMDSSPQALIKLASFYYEAVKIKGDDLKRLLRRGKGKTGGKTVIFERLFKNRTDCGYRFKNAPHYEIEIKDTEKFKSYIVALVEYLKKHPQTTSRDLDYKTFTLKKLEQYDFHTSVQNNKPNNHNTTQKSIQPKKRTQKTNVNPTRNINNKTLLKETELLETPSEKINAICKELTVIPKKNCPTAVSALVRVLITITVKEFFKCKKEDLKKNLRENINHISSQYIKNNDLKNHVTLLNKNYLTKNLNEVMHNAIFSATESKNDDLWKNLKHFLKFLWEEINLENNKK